MNETSWVIVVVGAVVLVIACFMSYWVGSDSGSKQAYFWKKKYEEERNDRQLLRKQCDGLLHEIEQFSPKSVWRNERWYPADQRYGVYPPARPSGHQES